MSAEGAYAIGRRYEEGLSDVERRMGAHFTPPDVAETLVRLAFAEWSGPPPVVCDPACGGGAFLVAAAEHLRRGGVEPRAIVERHLVGIDLDPGAAATTREALIVWAAGHGVDSVTPRVEVGDSLLGAHGVGGVDVVVGNPPFQNQLGGGTARSAGERTVLAARFGDAALGYVDTAALFQLAALDLVGPDGVVALILPRSFLVARDARAVRDRVLDVGVVRAVWLPGERVFDAKVDVGATVVTRRREPGRAAVAVVGGRDAGVRHPDVDVESLRGAPTWSPVWASSQGVPPVVVPPTAIRLGHVASTTAGFRDQYYGLLPHLTDDEPVDGLRLATTAMIDPGGCRWADREVTVARVRRTAPWLDAASLDRADERLGTWVRRLAVPKVLVAPQTRVIEAVADHTGDLVPFTPVVAVVPTPGPEGRGRVALDDLEAGLLAPAATAWALRRFGGSGLSATSFRLSAAQLRDVPLPTGSTAEAVELLVASRGRRRRPWEEIGRRLNDAWGLDDPALLEWWRTRIESSPS